MSRSADVPKAEGRGLGDRLREELGRYLIVCTYLYVWFVALLAYKAVLLEQGGIHYVPLGVALGKALIIGKFILIGEAMGLGKRLASRRLTGHIGQRVILLLLLVAALTLVEDALVGLLHGHTIADSWAELRSRSMSERLAELLLMAVLLVPLVTMAELNRALGPGVLQRVLNSKPAADSDRAGGEREITVDRG